MDVNDSTDEATTTRAKESYIIKGVKKKRRRGKEGKKRKKKGREKKKTRIVQVEKKRDTVRKSAERQRRKAGCR